MTTIEELKKNPLFKGIPDEDLEALLQLMKRVSFAKDEMLFRKGDTGDTMYLIDSGRVRIFIEDEQGNQIEFRAYEKGAIVGEFSIFDQQPRSASADAAVATDVLALQRDKFLQFLKERPVMGLAMMRSLSERIRYTTTYLEKVIDWTDWLATRDYDEILAEISVEEADDSIQSMISTFIGMVKSLQARHSDSTTQALNGADTKPHTL
jgi:CRP-like cAMP-binding protein